MRRTGPTNKNLQTLIDVLKKKSAEEKVGIWKSIALQLEKPTRQRRVVNLSKINRFTAEKDTIVVPGKVLSAGDISKPVTVAAYNFSDEAVRKIESVGGKALGLQDLIKSNPKGQNLRIIG